MEEGSGETTEKEAVSVVHRKGEDASGNRICR